MCYINIQLTIYLFTVNKYCICILLDITITHYQNKTLYNKVFFGTNFMDSLMFLGMHRTSPKLNYANKGP